MQRFYVVAAAMLALAGCAGSYEPIIDAKGINEAQYQQDLSECRAYADQVSPGKEAAVSGATGAILGSALGAIAGAFGGSAGTGAAIGASIGGASGAAGGAGGGAEAQQQVIANCLRHRGYAVLR
jgi:hypothetical protein